MGNAGGEVVDLFVCWVGGKWKRRIGCFYFGGWYDGGKPVLYHWVVRRMIG